MMKKNILKERTYFYLFLIAFLSVVTIPFFISNGGLVGDSHHYFRLAYYFPKIKWSVFPLGYPIVLRFFKIFTADYFWAGRTLNVLCYLSIGLFSYIKKFHFKETAVLLCTKIFFFAFFNIISEGFFLFLMYFLFYCLYKYFDGGLKSWRFYLPASILLIYMFSVRYSALYIYFALAVFYLYYFYREKGSVKFFKNDYFIFLIFSGLGIFSYTLFNFINFGDFMGEKFRNKSNLVLFSEDSFFQVISVFNSFNPILGLKFWHLTKMAIIAEGILFIINLIFIVFFVKIWMKYFKRNFDYFYILIVFIGVVYTLLMFLSSFFQGIETLNIRLLCEASFCYFYVMIFLYFKEGFPTKFIFGLAVFSLIFNSAYAIKDAQNFLEHKKRVENALRYFKGKKYFNNDSTEKVKATIYKIPFINKEIRYVHPGLQEGPINEYITYSKDPTIEMLVKDTVKNKSKVLYNSEIERKMTKK